MKTHRLLIVFTVIILCLLLLFSWLAIFPRQGAYAQTGTENGLSMNARFNELFAIVPSISLNKTVGTNPGLCATTDSVAVLPGGQVTYCYEITNTGTVTLTRHTLEDSELGIILSDFPYTLSPGASAFLTQTTTIFTDTNNLATWTSYNPGPIDVVSATDSATVVMLLPDIRLLKTVGIESGVCATANHIGVTPGTDVTYCYEITNTGGVTLTRHTLEDSELGIILNDFPYTLSPGASAFLTQTVPITQTTVNTATWTAYNPGPSNETSSTTMATVSTEFNIYLPIIHRAGPTTSSQTSQPPLAWAPWLAVTPTIFMVLYYKKNNYRKS